MPVSATYVPRKFSWNKVADDKLPEGRISVPFSLLFTNTGDEVALPFLSGTAGIIYTLNARTLQNVQNFTAFKSVSFVATFQSITPDETFPAMYLFSPDSGDFHQIQPATPVDATLGADTAYVVGSVPIISNGAELLICAAVSATAGSSLTVQGNANNFEQSPYLYSSPAIS